MTQSLPSPWLCLPAHLSPPLLSDTFSCLCHPPHFLAPSVLSLSEFLFESLSLKGRLQLLQTSPEACHLFFLFVALFYFSLSLFLFDLLCPLTQPWQNKHTHTKPIVAQPSKWLAGNVKCSVTSSQQIQSLEMQRQPESPKGRRGFLRNADNHTKLTALLFPSVPPSSITGNLYEPAESQSDSVCCMYVCVCMAVYIVYVCA